MNSCVAEKITHYCENTKSAYYFSTQVAMDDTKLGEQ